MREQILRQFFEGKSSARELARDVSGSTRQSARIRQSTPFTRITSIKDMDQDLEVTAAMGIKLCDAVLAGELPAEALRTIGFALQASDKFYWDGDEDEVLASVIADWSCPEVNYPLTLENVARFRVWLMRVEPYPEKPQKELKAGRIISVHQKKRVRW